MSHYAIIAQSDPAAVALRQVADLMRGGEAGNAKAPAQVISEAASREPYALFTHLSTWLDGHIARESSSATVVTVLVDSIDPDVLSPLGTDSWNATIAMLILAFPEVHWVFGACNDTTQKDKWQGIFRDHALSALFAYPGTPLFDSSGLRNWARNRISPEPDLASPYHANRAKVAAAIDEEDSYAFLHAYAAYRFGYRANCLTSLAPTEAVFGSAASRGIEVTFEDLYLAFPDQAGNALHLSHLWAHAAHKEQGESRRDRLPQLESCRQRIIITSAHTKASDAETWEKNIAALNTWRQVHPKRNYEIIGKPTSGIFDLWQQAGFQLWDGWPPKPEKATTAWPRHSAPGRYKAVADSLLQRASRLAEEARRVPEIVKVAVLARDAMELIGHRTPTLAVEALALVHEMEVKAECEFAGVQYHFAVAPRISDLQRETHSMANWIDPTQRETFILNAQAAVMTRLVRSFREYGQFDEEQSCLVKLRELNRKLLVSRESWLRPAEPLMWYLELLLRSLPHFFGAIVVWLVGLSIMFFADSLKLDDLASGLSIGRICDASWVAFQTFVSVQPPQPPSGFPVPSLVLVGLAMLAGVTHIGVFISHMYAMISRR